MKGYIFVFVFFVCLATAAQAQLKFDREIQTGLFVPKGAWLVGTTLSYTELRSTDFKLLVLKDLNGDSYTFKISPFGGYFFADNVAAGLRLAYARSYINLDNLDLDLGDDLDFNVADQNFWDHSFMVSGFLRTYMGLGKSKVFGFFNEARLSYGYGQGKILPVKEMIRLVLIRLPIICRSVLLPVWLLSLQTLQQLKFLSE